MNNNIIGILAILLSLLPVSAQMPTSCSGSGNYCYADILYQCVDGRPQVIDYCSYRCENGACVSGAINPQIKYVPPESGSLKGSDMVFYLTLAIVLSAIAVLYLRIRLRK